MFGKINAMLKSIYKADDTEKKKNKISRNKKHNYWNLKLSDKFNNRLDKGEETINKMERP